MRDHTLVMTYEFGQGAPVIVTAGCSCGWGLEWDPPNMPRRSAEVQAWDHIHAMTR